MSACRAISRDIVAIRVAMSVDIFCISTPWRTPSAMASASMWMSIGEMAIFGMAIGAIEIFGITIGICTSIDSGHRGVAALGARGVLGACGVAGGAGCSGG